MLRGELSGASLQLERVDVYSTAQLWSLLRLLPEDVDALAGEASVANSDDNLLVDNYFIDDVDHRVDYDDRGNDYDDRGNDYDDRGDNHHHAANDHDNHRR